MSVFKVQCVKGCVVEIQSESEEFEVCVSEGCEAPVIMVSQKVSI